MNFRKRIKTVTANVKEFYVREPRVLRLSLETDILQSATINMWLNELGGNFRLSFLGDLNDIITPQELPRKEFYTHSLKCSKERANLNNLTGPESWINVTVDVPTPHSYRTLWGYKVD